MTNYIPDNYDIWLAHEDKLEQQLADRPVCDYCEDHIQDDHFFAINGETICPDCMEAHFRRELD